LSLQPLWFKVNIMNKVSLLFALVTAVIMFSCGDKEKSRDVELNVLGMVGSEHLVIGNTFDFDAGTALITKSDFYISDVQLVADDGSTYDALDIGFVDISLTHDELESSKIGSSVNLSSVPVGTYKELKISIGVPADLNGTVPSDYPNSNPLSRSSHYWSAWDSYIFQKIQGKYDADNDGTYETDFFYHTGSEALFETLTFDMSFEVADEEGNTITLELEHKAALGEGTNYLDLEQNPGQHDISDLEQLQKFTGNLQASMKVVQ